MADLSTHYKEISPEETVQNIRDFFQSHDFTINLTECGESEAGTWYCHLDLYNDDILIGGSNGKGMTKEYALASGHAELYERFCSYFFMGNPYWAKALIDCNKENGYNFRHNEKLLTAEEQLAELPEIETFFNAFTNDKSLIKDIFDYITDGQIIGLPYKSIEDDSEVYIDPRITIRMVRSMGMVAGNTKTEALIQGISELLEKQGYANWLKNTSESIYALELDKIENPQLQTMIKNLQDRGYDLYLIDLSYNYPIPVMMSILVDRERGFTEYNIGSFPVFDIAAERVITELYQGINSFHHPQYLSSTRIPYRMFPEPFYSFQLNLNSINGTCFPLEALENIQYKPTYNHDVYLDKECNNEDCLKYLIELSKKLDIHFYYLDNSLSDKMAALQIIVSGDLKHTGLEGHQMGLFSPIARSGLRTLMKLYSTNFNNIYNNTIDNLELIKLFNSFDRLSSIIGFDNMKLIFLWNYISISSSFPGPFNNFMQVINYQNGISPLPLEIANTVFYSAYKKYYLLQLYKNSMKYEKEELFTIFNKIFNFNITDEDLENASNNLYLIKKVYVEPLTNYLHSDKYRSMIYLFANK